MPKVQPDYKMSLGHYTGSNQCGLIVSSHAPCQMEIQMGEVDEDRCPLVAVAREGMRLEPDLGKRDSRHHKRIMMIRNIPNTRTGHHLRLECGHEVDSFGDLSHAGGIVWCQQCFDANARPKG